MGIIFKPGQKVFLDTAPLIYWFEENSSYISRMSRFFDDVAKKRIPLITSMITYIEVLTYPEKAGAHDLAEKYRNYFFNSEQLSIQALDISIADAAVRLRSQHGLKTPDAIQLATARICGCNYILSNDRKWRGITDVRVVLVPELPA